MLAHSVVTAFAFSLAMGSAVSAQIIGHSPGPRTRYEWNTNRPYSGGWSYGNGGYGGVSVGVGVGVGYPFGYNYYAPYAAYGGPVIVPPYGYGYGYYPGGVTVIPPSTATYGYVPGPIFTGPPQPPVFSQPNPLESVDDLEARLNAANTNRPIPKADRLPVLKPSTADQQQRSLRHMATADQQFKIGHYAGAALEYRRAIADAEDLPDNYFRLGFALAAQRRYDDAVQQWKYGLLLDPTWPTRGDSLTSLFGEQNQIEKSSLLQRAADYVRLDPRDPERIFLLGVLVHFDGDQANARTLFESATRVAGNESHLMAFLGTGSNPDVANAPVTAPPAPNAPRPSRTAPPVTSVPPASDPSSSSPPVPAPPPANVQRQRSTVPPSSTTIPPASLSPQDARPVPKRQEASPSPAEESAPAEKFPTLQAPKPPVGDI